MVKVFGRIAAGLAGLMARVELTRRGCLDFIDSRPPGAYRPSYGDLWFLYRAVRRHRPEVVLEFGSGCSTVVIARALADNGCGHLTSIDAEEAWAEVTRGSIPDQLRSYCEVVYSPAVEEEFAGVPVFRHVGTPDLSPDMIYLDGPALNTRVQAAVDPVLMEDNFRDGFVMVVDGRRANVEFLKSHLKRDYRVKRDKFFNMSVFRLRG